MDEKEKVVLQVTDQSTVTITLDEFRELVGKAVRLDAIAASVRQNVNAGKYSKVVDDIVLLLTGTMDYTKPETEADGTDE